MKLLTKLWLTLQYKFCMVNVYLSWCRQDVISEIHYNLEADKIYLKLKEIK